MHPTVDAEAGFKSEVIPNSYYMLIFVIILCIHICHYLVIACTVSPYSIGSYTIVFYWGHAA